MEYNSFMMRMFTDLCLQFHAGSQLLSSDEQRKVVKITLKKKPQILPQQILISSVQ
jgi:hypothetical protein